MYDLGGLVKIKTQALMHAQCTSYIPILQLQCSAKALVATLSTLFMSKLELEVFHHSVQYFMFMSSVGKQSTLYVGYDEVERP
jgi:hypothetical protein